MKTICIESLILLALLFLKVKAFSQDTNFFVFLCFGQSNMEGFPGIEEQDKAPVDGRFQVLAAVDFPKLKEKAVLQKNAGNGIPALVLVDQTGNMISTSESGGPQKVLNELDGIFAGKAPPRVAAQ